MVTRRNLVAIEPRRYGELMFVRIWEGGVVSIFRWCNALIDRFLDRCRLFDVTGSLLRRFEVAVDFVGWTRFGLRHRCSTRDLVCVYGVGPSLLGLFFRYFMDQVGIRIRSNRWYRAHDVLATTYYVVGDRRALRQAPIEVDMSFGTRFSPGGVDRVVEEAYGQRSVVHAMTDRRHPQEDFPCDFARQVGVRAARFAFSSACSHAVRTSEQDAVNCGVLKRADGSMFLVPFGGHRSRFHCRVEILSMYFFGASPAWLTNGIGGQEGGLVGACHLDLFTDHLDRLLCWFEVRDTSLHRDVEGRHAVVLGGALCTLDEDWRQGSRANLDARVVLWFFVRRNTVVDERARFVDYPVAFPRRSPIGLVRPAEHAVLRLRCLFIRYRSERGIICALLC